MCPKCSHDHGDYVTTRRVYQCANCGHQASVTAGSMFHSTNLSFVKWFWAIYLSGSDKGGISAEGLRKLIGVSWITASRMRHKLRAAMGEREADTGSPI